MMYYMHCQLLSDQVYLEVFRANPNTIFVELPFIEGSVCNNGIQFGFWASQIRCPILKLYVGAFNYQQT